MSARPRATTPDRSSRLPSRLTARAGSGDRDAGVSMVEVLVAVVLLGTAVLAILTTLRVSTLSSTVNRDHANAHAWLQSAADVLYGTERVDCGTELVSNEPVVRATYDAVLDSTTNPEGWPASNIEVVEPVLFWDGESYQTTCYDDDGVNLQLIELRVRDLNGKIVESVQVVKG